MTREVSTEQAKSIVRRIALAVVEASSGEHGCAESTIYIALMEMGCTIDQFETLISALCESGALRRESHRLYAMKK